MQILGVVWRVVIPLFVVALSAVALLAALRNRGKPPAMSRDAMWMFAIVLVIAAGDAAFGSNRPVFERQWKGATALLGGLAFGIEMWSRHRWRRRSEAEASAGPAAPRTPAGPAAPGAIDAADNCPG